MIERIKSDLKTKRFWLTFSTRTFAAVGFEAITLGLYDVINPNAISKINLPISLILLAAAAIYGLVRSWPRPIEQSYSSPKTEIRLLVGDLFSSPENLVIGMTSTFDTSVPHVIAQTSIQGQFLARIYHHDVQSLDAELAGALSRFSPIGTIEKHGKRAVYPIGTVATLQNKRQHYFCVAYSEMDSENRAQASIDGLWRSLTNLWDEVRNRANGDPVAMPIIGGGQSRISQILPAQDSIRFVALSFLLASRHSRVCERLDIFVRPEDAERIDMLDFQRFLTSLNSST
ncbi:macro domain-containing protein [Amycolatopsis sp. cmx-4-54]|uniref:macro domain-containing protein n=1 Tax=Amycolatopsis sp. cmx-4-54 TaxID=2790936 RepID=UPI003977F92D